MWCRICRQEDRRCSIVEKGVGELVDLLEEVMKAGGVESFPTGCVGVFVRVVIFVFDESMVRG